jgi:hypothetical protein
MNDTYLAALVDSVENGADPVVITLALTFGAVASGTLRHSRYFVDLTHQAFTQADLVGLRKWSEKAQEAAKEAASSRIEGINIKFDSSEADAITMSEVKMVWSVGDDLQVPGMRIATDAIAPGGLHPEKRSSSRGIAAASSASLFRWADIRHQSAAPHPLHVPLRDGSSARREDAERFVEQV